MLGVGVVIGVGVGVGAGASQRLQGSEIDRCLKQNLGFHIKVSILLGVYLYYYHKNIVASLEVFIKSIIFTRCFVWSCYKKQMFCFIGATPRKRPEDQPRDREYYHIEVRTLS